jgi:hypothetical protein
MLEKQFGKSVVATAPLYEVTPEYAMEIGLGSNCDVLQIKVSPKYFWEEDVPQWVEPDNAVSLQENQYAEILEKVQRLKLVGSLIERSHDTVYYVTNSKTYHWDRYERAFINRVMHCCPSDTPELMFSFTIYFPHNVQGKVTDTRPVPLSNDAHIPTVRIGDHWYLASATEFEKAKIGKRVTLNLAGPIN